MSSKLSRVVLAAGLLMGAWSLSSCSQQDGSPRTEETDAANYSRVPVSLSVEAALQPLAESSARAMSLELSEDEAKKKFPKLKGLKEGTEVLCVIRSSNPHQPVNYLKATWTKKEGTERYTISFGGNVTGGSGSGASETNFSYDSRFSLGHLSMMLITGGEWDQNTKQLKVEPKLVRAENSTMDYELPCVSEWRPLKYEFKNGTEASSLRLWLTDYDFDAPAADRTHYTLKPVGMLLRMPVEEEMAEDGGGHYQLNGITIRSTAFGGQGYFNLSESNIKATDQDAIDNKKPYYRRWWVFSKHAETDESYNVENPIEHSFDATGMTTYGTRQLRKFTPRYYLFLWVMPRPQQAEDVANGEVRTQIYANVDVKPEYGSEVIYSNSSSADEYEFNGHNGAKYAVVPRMKALPVYASDRLVRKAGGVDAAFVEGTSYSLTLNLNRPDLPIELLSQYPVNKDNTGFAKTAAEAAYIVNDLEPSKTQLRTINTAFQTLGQGNWSVAEFTRITMLFGAIGGKDTMDPSVPNERVDSRYNTGLSSTPIADAGTYGVSKDHAGILQDFRMLLGLQASKQGDKVVVYSLIFYPAVVKGQDPKNYRGDRMSVVRGEYTTNDYGQPVYRMRLRYIGPYCNDIGIMSPNMTVVNSENDLKPMATEALKKIIDKGEEYWNDPLRKQDDITRDLPLWKKDPTTNRIYKAGDAGYDLGDMGYIVFDINRPSQAFFGKLGIGYPASSYNGYSRMTTQAPVFLMRDRLTHK